MKQEPNTIWKCPRWVSFGQRFEQMKQFVADKSRVTWLIFVKSYKVPKDVPPIEEKRFDLEEHRKKIVIIRNSLIEVFEKK